MLLEELLRENQRLDTLFEASGFAAQFVAPDLDPVLDERVVMISIQEVIADLYECIV